jgi:hypothetical protein
MEWDLLDKAVPQGYIIAEPPAEAFRALRQAVADTPQARLLVSDESSGLITWFIRGETKEEQKARKRKTLGEPVLTVGSARWTGMMMSGRSTRVFWDNPEFVICTARIYSDSPGSRVQIRRAWWSSGQLQAGMPQSWVFEPETLARAGLRLTEGARD